MKKITAIIVSLLICAFSAFSLVSADYTLDESGNAVYDTAIGYCFDIDDINGTITGEDATIITNNEALANIGSKWAIWFVASELDDSEIYEVITNGAAMGGNIPAITLLEGEIFVAIHSASSNPNDAAQYDNWEDKVAALAVKSGDCLAFDGIDLNAGTCVNGRMLVVTKSDVLAGLIEFPDADEPATPVDPVIPSEPEVSTPVIEESTEDKTDGETEQAPETDKDDGSKADTEESVDEEIKTSVVKLGSWWDDWKWVIIGGIAGALAGVAVVLVIKLRKPKNKE